MTKLCDAYCKLLIRHPMFKLYILIQSHIKRVFAKSVYPECDEIWKIKIDKEYSDSNTQNELFKDVILYIWVFSYRT